jgi:hypothetical protein
LYDRTAVVPMIDNGGCRSAAEPQLGGQNSAVPATGAHQINGSFDRAADASNFGRLELGPTERICCEPSSRHSSPIRTLRHSLVGRRYRLMARIPASG